MTWNPKARPITFRSEMVQAIEADLKCETRRLIRNERVLESPDEWSAHLIKSGLVELFNRRTRERLESKNRYGGTGNLLWVQEQFAFDRRHNSLTPNEVLEQFDSPRVWYRSQPGDSLSRGRWRHARFMPRKLSRLDLEVEAAYPQQLTSMDQQNAIDEGVAIRGWRFGSRTAPLELFRGLWDELYGEGSWARGNWVWVTRFGRRP